MPCKKWKNHWKMTGSFTSFLCHPDCIMKALNFWASSPMNSGLGTATVYGAPLRDASADLYVWRDCNIRHLHCQLLSIGMIKRSGCHRPLQKHSLMVGM